MTHQLDPELLTTVMQLLTKEGSSGFAEGLRLLVNEAMVAERTAVLGARPYERSAARLGHADGYISPRPWPRALGPLSSVFRK